MRCVWRKTAAALLFLASSCMPKEPPSPFRELGATAAPLRDAFNANVGKVRILMLVAPT